MAGNIPTFLQQATSILPFKGIAANQYGPSVKTIGKGSLVNFNYRFFKHDPSPLIIVTDIFRDHIRGVNLHYLTLPFVKKILSANCDNTSFSYFMIKNDRYVVDSLRTYKRLGVANARSLDCSFLKIILASVRTFNPAEVEAMRQYVREQIRRQVVPKAEPTGEMAFGNQPQTGV